MENFKLLLTGLEGRADDARSLLAAGADVNFVYRSTSQTGPVVTPLLAASRGGHNDTLSVLLAAGADVNFADGDGFTALVMATGKGRIDTVSTLLAAGARTTATHAHRSESG